MSKKRANKSKRRRESQRPQAGTASSPAKEPRLKLIAGGAEDAISGVRAAANESVHSTESIETTETTEPVETTSEPPPPVSEPPASVEDLEEEARFFHEGRIQTPHAFTVADDLELDVEARKPSPKMTPVARARRAHFSKYVKGAMVAATAILTLAGIRVMLGRSDRNPDSYVTASVAAAPAPASPAAEKAAEPAAAASVGTTSAQIPAPAAEPEKAQAPVAAAEPAPAPEPAKVAEAPQAEAPKAEAPKAESPKAEAAKTDAPKADAPAADPAAGGKTAAQEKADSRRLLERGKSAAAIEAGERSVALDPTDGEAWLILGAAYQDKGNLKDARRAFQACAKQGKRGPVSECRAMLQQ